MRAYIAGFIDGAARVAAGFLIAAAVLAAGGYLIRPAPSITVDLGEYSCATDGKVVRCERK